MTEAERFKDFFSSMGINCKIGSSGINLGMYGKIPKKAVVWISISLAYFLFDKDQNYLGVYADDKGYFIPKEENVECRRCKSCKYSGDQSGCCNRPDGSCASYISYEHWEKK